MTTIRIDFETRSECDLKTAGAWKYSLDPTTEVLMYAYRRDAGRLVGSFVEGSLKRDFGIPTWTGCPFVVGFDSTEFEAHNAGFEYAIWTNQMVPKYGWPEMAQEQLYCSAAATAAHGLPRSLDGATKAMGLPYEKDKAGHAIMLKLCKPRPQWVKIKKGDRYFGTAEDFERLLEYCKKDVMAEYALSESLAILSPMERKIYLVDQKINLRGVHCDLPLATKAISLEKYESTKGNKKIRELTHNEVQTTGQIAKIREYINTMFLLDLPNLQAPTVDNAIEADIPDKAKEILKLRQKHSKSSVKKYAAMLARADKNGVIRETLLYHGAHTGRWTGKAIQPQNFPVPPSLSRPEIEDLIPSIMQSDLDTVELYRGSVSGLLSDTLRSTLTASPGNDLIGADYASIENRVLLWLADDRDALAKIRSGVDLYVDMASTIYGVPMGDVTSAQRKVGKQTVLGCGYQMGDERFEGECEKKGIFLPAGMAKRIIKAYRAKYLKVKALWYDVHRIAMRALTSPTWTTVGRKILFSHEPPFLFIDLPSGRRLAYKDPEIRVNRFKKKALSHMRVDPKTKKWVRTTTYGGTLVENIVSAIARDIMAEAMLRCEQRGYPIVMSIHDEIVADVPKGFGSIEDFENILCEQPTWAPGCPIAAEGWRGERYRK